MAEGGGIEGLVGEDRESWEGEARVAGADTVALAVATDAGKHDPELARKAGAYLEEQQTLVRFQIKHFDEEHKLAIAAAKRKRFADRVRNSLSAGILVILACAVIGLAWLAFDAVQSRQVVVLPFELSPGLATHNLTGRIVAAGVLDELSRMQMTSRSATQKSGLANAWEHELQIEIPETGLSITEVLRTLRDRFGHDVQVTGSLVETPTGELALTVRGTALASKTFYGTEAELEALIRRGAEYIYGQARPALWAAYLVNHSRYEESISFARANIVRTQGRERARLLTMWADAVSSVGSMHEAVALVQAAVKTDPDDWGSRADLIEFTARDGDEEDAWRGGMEMMRRAGGRPGRAPEIDYGYWDQLTFNLQAQLAAELDDLAATNGEGTYFGPSWAIEPTVRALQHDPESAERALGTAAIDDSKAADRALRHWANLLLAADRGDWSRAAKEGVGARDDSHDSEVAYYAPALACLTAVALEHDGQRAEADRSFALAANPDSVACRSYRGDVSELRGDWAGAQRIYAEAVAVAPDLPIAYYSWGRALAKHGDLTGAVAKLGDANRRGPHWADPLKSWGDVLAQQGQRTGALEKYDEALKYAPNWAALKDARDVVAKHTN